METDRRRRRQQIPHKAHAPLFMKNEKEEIKVPAERRGEERDILSEREIQRSFLRANLTGKARTLIIITLKFL